MAESINISINLQDLECAICMEMFDRDTRTLKCLHSFHIQCLRGIPRCSACDVFLLKCPLCRDGSVWSDHDNIPKNPFLIDLIDKVLSEKAKEESRKLKSSTSDKSKSRSRIAPSNSHSEENPEGEVRSIASLRSPRRLRARKQISYKE